MENKRDSNSSDFVNFGTYTAEETNILKPELEKRGIPVKVLYPGTRVGKETTAHTRWTAYTILVPAKDCKVALEICNSLSIKPRYKISLPGLLYTRVNRYIFGVIVLAYLLTIVLGASGLVQNEALVGVLAGVILFSVLLFFAVTSYKIIRKQRK